MERSRMLNLRAHHILCLIIPDSNEFCTTARKKFMEKGYTDNYINAYMKVFNIVRRKKDAEIKILDNPKNDDTCVRCGNYADGTCISPHATTFAKWDKEILTIFELKVNDVLKVRDLIKLVKRRVDPNNMPGVCRGCLFNLDSKCRERLVSANL
ncbi:MAG: DUF1284 domain-containing protein [Candidatus Bathyarchaeia archaeon]